jgi:hypothetical protein
MGQCSRCRQEKPDQDFAWRRKAKGQRDSYCRPCRAEYKQEHYAKNKKRYLRQATARNRSILEERTDFLHFFTTHPCIDCGETDPVVLEFDHLGNKAFAISDGIRGRKWESVLAEMEKCDVVCANCHRRRSMARGNFWRTVSLDAGDESGG